jgi:hypothetical protein
MDTTAQKFNLTMLSSKPDGNEEVSMKLEVDTQCSLNFMTNAFIQLMRNEDGIKTAMLMASLYELLGGEKGMRDIKDYKDIDDIINKVINKNK